EVQKRNIVGVIEAHPDIAKKGVLLRKFGQEVIRVTAGKRVHGTGSIPGGMNRHVSTEDRAMLLADIAQVIAWSEDAVAIARQLHAANRELYDGFGAFRSKMFSLVRPDGALELYDGVLRARDEDGAILIDGAGDQGYRGLIDEDVKPWTYMKFPYLRALGREAGWYRVGPLARVQNCDFIDTPRAEAARREFMAFCGGAMQHATLAYHWARMIEVLHCAEVIERLLDDPAILSGELVGSSIRAGVDPRHGVGIIEAPRGTLIHDYDVGDDDLVTRCNLIVSTTHNNQAMNEAVRSVARQYLDGREITEGLLNRIEVAIRAYDPCLSCATHALGRMPLDVTLLDAGGTVLDQVLKSADGSLERG
ncbi:MAG: Ni/Fe hydrogenase subunit alpha, partial [Piscinibacter sp.]|uniref:Ni/Fe hydrogenase subunit alpha n=1 Tax=Piscinibacter sp. TaxID=1903157 RepID=UPI003D107F42